MANIKFHDYLNGQLKDPTFRAEFETECTELTNTVTLSQAQAQSVLQSIRKKT